MYRRCVIDTSSLIYLTFLIPLRIFDHLRLFTQQLHIPYEVFQEYEKGAKRDPRRNFVIERTRINGGFFLYCTTYDSISLAFLKTTKGIDPGEAEAAAQQKSVGAEYIISDDRDFVKSIRSVDRHVKILSTLHVMAHLQFLAIPVSPFLKKLKEVRPFTQIEWQTSYRHVAKELGVTYSKKEFNERTMFKNIGL
jgi:hypothetical protein